MMRLIKKLCTWVLIPTSWTGLTIILLCIPGQEMPDGGVFATEGLDKLVHALLFGGIVLLWGFHLYFRRAEKPKWRKIIVVLTFLSTVLGIGLEYIQLYFIPNRSFDVYDIIADSAGAVIAGLYHLVLKVK